MPSQKQVTFLSLLAAFLLIGQTAALQKDDGAEDYGPEGAGPPGGGSDGGSSGGKADPSGGGASGTGEPGADGADKGGADGGDVDSDPAKTKFSDDRFAKLFPSRGGGRNFHARNVAKPKPTLPSFIKSTPPLVKVQVSTTPTPRGGVRGRGIASTTKRSSLPSTTARPRRGNALQPTQRQLSGRLTTSAPSNRLTSAPNSATASATPSAAALAAARRARQGNGISRFNRNMSSFAGTMANSNSTIPALNPRRNN